MNDGVLTTKDFINQKNITGATKNVVPDNKKNVSIEYKYRFPPAPMGKSQTTINYKDKSMKLKMDDGVYVVPKNWNRAEKEKFHRFIITLGFEDVCEVNGKIKEEKKDDTPKIMIYKIGHPDNTKTEKVDGSVSVKIRGKDRKFDCVKGVVTTEKKEVFNAFLKKGWYEVSIEPKKEKKNES